MKTTRSKIIKGISDYSNDFDKLNIEFNKIVKEDGEKAYQIILHVLSHLNIEDEKAKKVWKEIVKHHKSLCKSLKREPNISTTFCDYFCSINKSLKSPKIIDLHIFEDNEKFSKLDCLTGLYNRRHFDEILKKESARALRHNQELSILFLDLDNFKRINDTFGHLVGDEILIKVAQVVMDVIRLEDLAVRYGGEEFVVVLPQTQKFQSLVLAERIRIGVEELGILIDGEKLITTISGGISTFPQDSDDCKRVVDYADKAMYQAKGEGKNEIILYSQDKRKYFRIDYFKNITITNIENQDVVNSINALGKNLSKDGILIESTKYYKIGCKITLNIPLSKREIPLIITGTVVRIEAFSSGSYEIGISFLKMNKDFKKELGQFLISTLSLSTNFLKQTG